MWILLLKEPSLPYYMTCSYPVKVNIPETNKIKKNWNRSCLKVAYTVYINNIKFEHTHTHPLNNKIKSNMVKGMNVAVGAVHCYIVL